MNDNQIMAITGPLAFILIACSIIWSLYLSTTSKDRLQLKAMELNFCVILDESTGKLHRRWVQCEKVSLNE
jgi:hypothetical protein